MESVKKKIQRFVEYSQLVDRIAELAGCTPTNRAVSSELEMSETNFSNKLLRKTLFEDVVLWAIQKGHSVNYVLTGKSEVKQNRKEKDVEWLKAIKHIEPLLNNLNAEESSVLAESIEATLKLKEIKPPGRSNPHSRPTRAQKRQGGRGGR